MANPTFAKALVRYNPEGDSGVNENQQRRLKVLCDHTHSEGYKFMFELLVPATEGLLESVKRISGTCHGMYRMFVYARATTTSGISAGH